MTLLKRSQAERSPNTHSGEFLVWQHWIGSFLALRQLCHEMGCVCDVVNYMLYTHNAYVYVYVYACMCTSVLSRLFLGGAAPPIVQIYPPISVSETAAPPSHKSHGMQSRFVFNNYYQTAIHMQVHSNRLHYSDARGG